MLDTFVFLKACREGDPPEPLPSAPFFWPLEWPLVLPLMGNPPLLPLLLLWLPFFVFFVRPIRPRWFTIKSIKSGDSPPDSGPGTLPLLVAPLPDLGNLNCDSTNSGAKRAALSLLCLFLACFSDID